VVWAHKYGQSVHQEGSSYKEWQAEIFSAFQSRPAHKIRGCKAISAQEAAAFTAHQAEEARKKIGVKKGTYTSKSSSICNMNDTQPSDSRSGMGLKSVSLKIHACEGCNKVR